MKLALRYGLAALLIVVAVIVLVIPPFATSLIEKWSGGDVELRSLLAFNASVDELTNIAQRARRRAHRRPVRKNGSRRGTAGRLVLRQRRAGCAYPSPR